MNAYQHGDFKSAFRLLSSYLNSNSQNASAWYLMGDCYLKMNERDKAREAFTRCLSLNPAPSTAEYAEKALSAIGGGSGMRRAPAPVYSPGINSAADTAISTTTTLREENSAESQEQAQRNQLLRNKEEVENIEIQRVENEANQEMAQIPDYWYENRHRVPNPEKPALVQAIRAKTDAKIAELKQIYQKQEQAILADYGSRINSLREFSQNTQRWSYSGQGNNQQVSRGTNLYIHNYVNFGLGELEPQPLVPLKAEALSLKHLHPPILHRVSQIRSAAKPASKPGTARP